MSTVKNGMTIPMHKSLTHDPKDVGVNEEIKPALNIYHIFLSEQSGKIYTEEEFQIRRYAATVIAKDLEDAFLHAQTDFNPDYAKNKVRSCAVGDLIQDTEGFYMVCESGFKLICLLETGHD